MWFASGIYMVSPAEEGVVRRFGKMVRVTSQGLRYHLPWPIERVDIITQMGRYIRTVKEAGLHMEPRPAWTTSSMPT